MIDLSARRLFCDNRGCVRHSFAEQVEGLTVPWSSGACQGAVNRIKMLMRQTFGRAGFPLLRKRILLT